MLRIATFRNIQINVWTDAPDVHQLRAFARKSQQFCQSWYPRNTALLNATLRGRPHFSEGVRDELVKVMRMRGVFRLGTAHLITVSGLPGSAARAFLSTGILIARPKTPTKVFGVPKITCDWLEERAAAQGDYWTSADLLVAYYEAISGR